VHPRNILADIDDTSADLGDFANMSLDFGNMSLDDQAPIVNDRSRSPDHSEEAEDPQPSLTGWIPERERLSASPDLRQSERNSDLELEGISDVSQQPQSEIGPDQIPTLTSDADDADEDAAEAPDPGCQESDRGELVPDEREGVGMIPGVTRDVDLQELSDLVQIDDIKIAMEFVRGLESATLDDKEMHLDSEALERLRNPPQYQIEVPSSDLRLAVDLYLAVENASQDTYNAVRTAILRRYPESELLSYAQTKNKIAQMSGITPLVHNMCINSCLAYTGPFATLETCPTCGESRYDQITLTNSNGKVKKPRQEFHSIPIGPQLQALWRHSDSAASIQYCDTRTAEIINELERSDGLLDSYDDFFHGSEYLQAVNSGHIKPGDMILMFSMDGAQLYRNKLSDCWIGIWIIFNHSPDRRYKKVRVLPAFFVPGPNKPKNCDSYLYPSLHHLAALQKEGIRVWDASSNRMFTSTPFLALATADGPGMVYLNGLVGYHGKNGCRLYCGVTGRHKPGGAHYYPVLLKPHNYDVEGCDHDDIDPYGIAACSSERYYENLRQLLSSNNITQYKKRRLETGIAKPSIFIGLPRASTLGVPGCFGSDIMHLVALNLPDLLLSLWRGTIDCDKTDDRRTWDWAVLKGHLWKVHGEAVAATTPYLPGSFDRPPRNPAEKINSGYKAWEFLMYIYGLGPGLFYNILPEMYWENFCKLVYGIRIIHQHEIATCDLRQAHEALIGFVTEFEELYYQRRTDRIHFVRPVLHGVLHLAPEVTRVGPGLCASQWTIERTIGNLGEEIRQPSNPYANLSQRGLRRCQVNALKAIFPDLEPNEDGLPRGAIDIGNSYILLRAMQKNPKPMHPCEAGALRVYLQENGGSMSNGWCPSVYRWARLRLPNGQIARSAWKEKLKPLSKVRMARNVKVYLYLNCIPVHLPLA
jgi:hypothetical protein